MTAYVYATFYTALDVISGIGAGYVTHGSGRTCRARTRSALMFRIGTPLGEVGSWALLACCVCWWSTSRPRGAASLRWSLLVPGAWLVHIGHIFAPEGVAGMTLLGWARAGSPGPGRRGARRRPPNSRLGRQPNRGARVIVGDERIDTGDRGRWARGMGHTMDIMIDGPTLVLSGDFDVRSTWEVRTAIYEQLGGHDGDVVIDLTDVGALDVTALQGSRRRDPLGLPRRATSAARLRPRRTTAAAPVPADPRGRGRAPGGQRLVATGAVMRDAFPRVGCPTPGPVTRRGVNSRPYAHPPMSHKKKVVPG